MRVGSSRARARVWLGAQGQGASQARPVRATIRRVWSARGDRYSEIRTAETAALRKIEMSYIGG